MAEAKKTIADLIKTDILKNWHWYAALTFAGVFMILGIYGGLEIGRLEACTIENFNKVNGFGEYL